MDGVDCVGKTLSGFDGLFESEFEKETYYIEALTRTLAQQGEIDIISNCTISQNLSLIRELLNNFGSIYHVVSSELMKILITRGVKMGQMTFPIMGLNNLGLQIRSLTLGILVPYP